MHSRIIELNDEPILEHERMSEISIPERFYHTVVDYIYADTNRKKDIEWFFEKIAMIADLTDDGESFTFKPKAKQEYFKRQYHQFVDKARELSAISLDAFAGETEYDIERSMYRINDLFADKFDSYIYYKGSLESLDEWIRRTDLSSPFYFGGTLGYHF